MAEHPNNTHEKNALSMTPALAKSMYEVAQDVRKRAERALCDTDRREPVHAFIVAATLAVAFRSVFDDSTLCTCEACQDELNHLAGYVEKVGTGRVN